MISSVKVSIIDFENFGMTSLPLHDEYSLGLSFYQLSPKNYKTSLRSEINYCIWEKQNSLGFSDEVIAGLYLHHLLIRLGAWSELENRAEFRNWIFEKLDFFLNDPKSLFKL